MKTLLLVIALSVLSGCIGSPRHCGAFYLPNGGGRSTVDQVGESATFASASGERLVLTLVMREDSEPYWGNNFPGPASPRTVVCRLRSLRRYVFDGVDAGLLVEITHSDFLEVPFEARHVSMYVNFEAPSGTRLHPFHLDLWELERHEPTGLVEHAVTTRILRNASFGGTRYDVALEAVFTNSAHIESETPSDVEAVTGVVFAHDPARGGWSVLISPTAIVLSGRTDLILRLLQRFDAGTRAVRDVDRIDLRSVTCFAVADLPMCHTGSAVARLPKPAMRARPIDARG